MENKDHNLKSYTDKILGRNIPIDLFRECEAYARRKMVLNELRTGNRYGDDYLPFLIADTIREREFSRYTIKRYTQEAAL